MPTTRRSSLGNELCLWILPSTLCSSGSVCKSMVQILAGSQCLFFCHILQYQVILMFIVTESRCSDSTVEPSLMDTPQQITDNSESPDCPSITSILKQPQNSGHPATQYTDRKFLCSLSLANCSTLTNLGLPHIAYKD